MHFYLDRISFSIIFVLRLLIKLFSNFKSKRMFYRERQDPMPDKEGIHLWRPEVVRTGKTVDIRKLSQLISTASTLTEADIYATLSILPQFMNIYLREGHTVRLDGLGTFTIYGRSKGKGVEEKEDVRPSQFTNLICKFTPEYTVSTGGTRTRALLDDIEFTNISRLTKSPTKVVDDGNEPGDGGGGDDDDFIDPTT